MVVGFYGTEISPEIKELIHDYHIGGIILFARNIGTPKEILTLTTALQREAKKADYTHPLLICLDQENGVVRRLGEGTTLFPGAMTLGATDDPNLAYQVGFATGKELKALGINWNLAPVLDVNNNPNNPVIGVRSFGESPEKVAEFGRASMKGMQDAGVITTLKHFPGHGDTAVDSHLDLPVISHDRKRLNEIELYPFQKNIEAGADIVMTAHVYFPAIEPEAGVPATLSSKVITGLLREELDFSNVITTDCMEMNAISEGVGTEKGAVKAVKAGVDIIMISHTFGRQIGAIKEMIKAVENGEIAEKMIDQSNQRIQSLKEKYLNWNDILLDKELAVPHFVGSHEHEKLAHEVYKKGVTIVKNENMLPLDLSNNQSILAIYPDNKEIMGVEDKEYASLSLGNALKEYHSNVDVHQFSQPLSHTEVVEIVDKANQSDVIVVGTLTIKAGSKQIQLIEKIIESGKKVIGVSMRSPYDFVYLQSIPAFISTYEFSYPALKVAAGAIFGEERVSGKLPVTI